MQAGMGYFMMFLPVLLLLLIAVMVKYHHAYWLISGYNTMPKEKKQNVDIEGLANLTGNFCFVLAGVIGMAFIFLLNGYDIAAGIIFALIFPLTIYMMIKAQHFDGNNRNPDGTMKHGSKLKMIFTIAFLVIVGIAVSVLLYQSYQLVEFTITEEHFVIKGIYGEKIAFADITEVALIQEIPQITARTNGSSLGERKKGHFRLKDLGPAKLFLDSGQPPYIYIERGIHESIIEENDQEEQDGQDERSVKKAKPVILNFVSEEETKLIYKDLYTAWKKAQKS